MSDHEGNCIIPEGYEPPAWQFDWWNIGGMILTMTSGVAQVAAQGLNMMAQECWTHARWRKQQREAAERWEREIAERQEMAEAYEHLVGLDTLWLESEERGDDG